MGAITRSVANNITTGGVILPAGINDASVASITELAQVSAGDGITLISSQTASASASISFTTGIDSTYRTYLFKFINIHPASDNPTFGFQASTNGGSSYNETMTTTNFRAYHFEGGGEGIDYIGGNDQAQGTGFQVICGDVGNGSDESIIGVLNLFNPSSTTFVKHFMSRFEGNTASDYAIDMYTAGYFNTTSAINAISFKFSVGNIDAGTIHMYGIA